MEFSSAVYGAIALSLLFYYLLSAKSKTAPPHAGGPRLITGHLHLIHGGPSAGLPHVNLATLADKHGPAFTIQLGVRRALVVSSPLLAKQTNYDKTTQFQTKLAKHFGPEPAIPGPGPHDHELRDLFSSACVSEIARLVNGLYNGPGRVRVDVGRRVRDLGLNVVLMAVAGKRLGGGDGEEERWRRVVGEFFRLAGVVVVVVDAFPHFGWLDVGGYEKRMKETSTEMGEIIGGWLAEHRRRREYSGEDVPGDFMDVMLAAAAEDGKLYGQHDVDAITRATCKSLIAGVSNTTTIMLVRTLSLLLNNPHVMKRTQQELDKHVGRERRVINESDINNLVYLQAIVKEALRLYPPTPLGGPREFTESCNVGGYHVPKGTWLIVNLWKLQRDPQVWMDDPSEFRPERFLDTNQNLDHDYGSIPFGAGRRVCHETKFCVQALHLVLANMLQAFELSRVSDEQVDMCELVDGVLNSKDVPLDVLVAPRLSPSLY